AQTGDRIRLSVRERRLDLLVPEDELARRRAAWKPAPAPRRGWDKLVHDQVLQAPEGADLAFLRPEGR
ncbi:MAG: dihydroxy-acid dehydratase, partial [Acetobacteraceae bacterium]|nr:dihydroxy-acid dehydratase [Acetobacteraceae bacterium]MBX6745583.1 dihydroxy-acid dehydratase [Acetobacteraceae bacterium]